MTKPIWICSNTRRAWAVDKSCGCNITPRKSTTCTWTDIGGIGSRNSRFEEPTIRHFKTIWISGIITWKCYRNPICPQKTSWSSDSGPTSNRSRASLRTHCTFSTSSCAIGLRQRVPMLSYVRCVRTISHNISKKSRSNGGLPMIPIITPTSLCPRVHGTLPTNHSGHAPRLRVDRATATVTGLVRDHVVNTLVDADMTL